MSADDSGDNPHAPLLAVRGVVKHYRLDARIGFSRRRGVVRAVDGVTLDVPAGATLSIVGESGCGKTTLGKVILGLERPTVGEVHFLGRNITAPAARTVMRQEGAIEAVFQDPWSSLNPRRRVAAIVGEPLTAAGNTTRAAVESRVRDLLGFVGLNPATLHNFPHEFSGGQRQRIAIARALSVRPRLIVLDEPVSALDVSIRAQIINLLRDIQRDLGTSYFMIAHDLATVRFLSMRVAVMYLGVIVEEADTEMLFTEPRHPYTQALLSASLPLRPGVSIARIRLKGEVPSATDLPSGCRFRTRCPAVMPRCATEMPSDREVTPNHFVACHLYQ
ncbi:MAG: ABC transporter ATP-binding protein [Burkholderiales bacterium]